MYCYLSVPPHLCLSVIPLSGRRSRRPTLLRFLSSVVSYGVVLLPTLFSTTSLVTFLSTVFSRSPPAPHLKSLNVAHLLFPQWSGLRAIYISICSERNVFHKFSWFLEKVFGKMPLFPGQFYFLHYWCTYHLSPSIFHLMYCSFQHI